MNTIFEFLQNKSTEFGDKTFLTNVSGSSVTYGNFLENIEHTLELLKKENLHFSNSNFSIIAPNCFSYLYLLFGLQKLGNAAVNLNPLLANTEIEGRLKRGHVELLVTTTEIYRKISEVIKNTFIKAVVFIDAEEINIKTIETIRLNNNRSIPPQQEGVAFLQYTGGTTGTVKAAVITHQNVLSNVRQLTTHFGGYINLNDLNVIIAFPFYHIFSIVFNVLFFMNNGGRCILFSDLRNTGSIIDIFNNHKITFTVGVNTWYKKLMSHERFSEIDFSNLKTSIAGGEYVPVTTKEQWQNMVGNPLYSAYGLTETSALAIVSPIDNTNIDDSIGIPIPETKVVLLDENNEEIREDNFTGEIALKGPQVTSFYYNQPEETKNAFVNGWFKTGDIAEKVNQNYFKIIDRKKDMISVSGNKVYPSEVEEVLSKINGILDVGVVAKKSEKSGEEVVACIVVQPGIELSDEKIIEYCNRYLAKFKIPKHIYRFTELPKSPIGKTVKYELRNKINNHVEHTD